MNVVLIGVIFIVVRGATNIDRKFRALEHFTKLTVRYMHEISDKSDEDLAKDFDRYMRKEMSK